MTNHLYRICSVHPKQEPALVLKYMKSFTAIKLMDAMFNQRINYLHHNPVTAGFVITPWYWKHSSAIDYITKRKRAA